MFVSTYRELAVGSLVDLEFSLPGTHRTVHTRGEVRWHRDAAANQPPGVGIAFEEIPDEDRALIHRFCTMRPPLYYDDVGSSRRGSADFDERRPARVVTIGVRELSRR